MRKAHLEQMKREKKSKRKKINANISKGRQKQIKRDKKIKETEAKKAKQQALQNMTEQKLAERREANAERVAEFQSQLYTSSLNPSLSKSKPSKSTTIMDKVQKVTDAEKAKISIPSLDNAKRIISDLNISVGIPTGDEDENSPYSYVNPDLSKEALLELQEKLKQNEQLRQINSKAKLKEAEKQARRQSAKLRGLIKTLDDGAVVQHNKEIYSDYYLYRKTKNRIKAELDLLTKSPEYANLGIELDQDLLIEAATNLEVRRNLKAKADKARKDRYDEKMKYQIEIDRRLRELEKKYKKYDYDPSKAGVSEHTQNMEELRSVMAKVSFNKGKDWLDILDDNDFVVIKEKVSKAKVWNAVIDAFNPDDMLKAVDKMPSVQRKSITGGNVDDRMQMLGMYLKVCKEDLMV